MRDFIYEPIPKWLEFLEERLCNGLSDEESEPFAEQLAASVTMRLLNFDSVKWNFLSFILLEQIERLTDLEIEHSIKAEVLHALNSALEVVNDAKRGGFQNSKQAKEKRDKAHDLAVRASASCASSRPSAIVAHFAVHAVEADAVKNPYTPASNIANCAEASALVYKEGEEREKAYKRYANELIRLLKETK